MGIVNGLFGALCGAGFGIGVLMVRHAFRPKASRSRTSPQLAVKFDLRPLLFKWRRLLLCLAAGIAAVAATGWPVAAVLAAAGCWWLPAVLGPDRESERIIARTEGCAGFAEMLRDTLSAASGLTEAALAASSVPPKAIEVPLRTLHSDLRHGVKVTEALGKLADTLVDPIADLICATLIHANGRPSRNLPATLTALASEARDQALAMRKTVAARAQIRTAVRVITAVILGITILLLVTDSAYLDPFSTAAGQLDLAVAGGIFAAGFAWLIRIARPASVPRFLTRLDALNQAPKSDDLPPTIPPRPRAARDTEATH
ncbi:type II secretion system F family protein [Catenulispora rubra]|uniref:type II secretion system F family protein n=1 Tax=Catenulispora rubra TaxID=280293 RepID=UPI00189283AE|nr:type II secretion system F family protein [Catenulispora rubra]